MFSHIFLIAEGFESSFPRLQTVCNNIRFIKRWRVANQTKYTRCSSKWGAFTVQACAYITSDDCAFRLRSHLLWRNSVFRIHKRFSSALILVFINYFN